MKILSILFGIILLYNSLFPIIPLPGMVSLIALIGATIFLIVGASKGGIMGKISIAFAIIIGVYTLVAILNLIGISLPFISFIYRLEKISFILGGVILIIDAMIN
jgi:hypothetical protein